MRSVTNLTDLSGMAMKVFHNSQNWSGTGEYPGYTKRRTLHNIAMDNCILGPYTICVFPVHYNSIPVGLLLSKSFYPIFPGTFNFTQFFFAKEQVKVKKIRVGGIILV